jgi:predicted DCC family thiol-disulfide oxidoreductase YuxK
MALARPVLLYDAGCRLCRFAARVVLRLDGDDELALLPLDDADAEPILSELPKDERFSSWRLALPDGSLAGHGAGGVELLRALRRTRRASRVLEHVPRRALDALYRGVERRRGLLGRLVPDGVAPRRFP